MATVLRVKRRLDEEPLDALLISCKRKKTEHEEAQVDSHASSSPPLTAVVKFAGTIQNQGENIAKHISNTLSKDELKAHFKQRVGKKTFQETARSTTKEKSKQNRWKVINCSRSIDTENDEESGDNGMTIIDVEDCSVELPNNEAAEYVYDLYYTKNEEEFAFDNGVSIHEIECDIDWSDHRGGEQYIEHDDSDSNSESYFKNDYPDSDPFTDDDDDSINEEDMIRAVNRCRINSDYDLSSDDPDDDDDSDPEYALNQADINIGGRKYAKWKLQLRKEINGTHDDDDDDDKSDSDCSNYSGPIITEVNDDNDE